jgi:hypothetical protein
LRSASTIHFRDIKIEELLYYIKNVSEITSAKSMYHPSRLCVSMGLFKTVLVIRKENGHTAKKTTLRAMTMDASQVYFLSSSGLKYW